MIFGRFFSYFLIALILTSSSFLIPSFQNINAQISTTSQNPITNLNTSNCDGSVSPLATSQSISNKFGNGSPITDSYIHITSASLNGIKYDPSCKSIQVNPHSQITGSLDISTYNSGPGFAVYVIGSTPTWNDHASSFWSVGSYPPGQSTAIVTVDVTSPSTPGTYYLIVAGRWELTASQVMSGTNWAVGHLDWNQGHDVAGWNDTQIYWARSNGLTVGPVEGQTGITENYIPADALKIIVAGTDNNAGILSNTAPFTPTNNGLTVNSPVITPDSTSLQLPAGQQMYIFGMGTGGAFQSSNLANQYVGVVDAAGNLATALSYGSSNSNSFTTGTASHTIGGVSVSGFSNMATYYGSNPNTGANSASVSFSVVNPNSLVIIMSLASSQTYMTLNGLSGLTTDASSANSTPGITPMIIAHAYLGPGSYTISETSSSAPGGDPSHMTDLIGVFVFSPIGLSGQSTGTVKQLSIFAPPNSNAGSTGNSGLNFQSTFIPNPTGNDYSMVLEIKPAVPGLYFTWSNTQAKELVTSLYQQLGSNGFTINSKSNFSIDVVTKDFSDSQGGKLTEGLIACSDLTSSIIGKINVLGLYDGAMLSIPEIISNSVNGNTCGDNSITNLMNAVFATLSSGVTALENDYSNGGVTAPSDQPNYSPIYIITDQHSTNQKLIMVITGLTPPTSAGNITFAYVGQNDIGTPNLAGPLLLTENNFNTNQIMDIPPTLNSNTTILQSFLNWLFHL